MTPGPGLGAADDRFGWRGTQLLALAIGFVAACLVRAVLLPRAGLAGDLDEFASWVHLMAIRPIGQAYDTDLTFPPVMVFVWSTLAAIEPAFRTVADASDPWIRVLLKTPPTVADFAIGAAVGFALRHRPVWAVAATLAIWLHPAIVDVSALFGQYESIYTLFGLIAFLLAVANRPSLTAVALGLAVMTKPQALPFFVPFAAWYLAVHGWRRTVASAGIGLVTIAILWVPFLADGGPAGYLRSIEVHQDELFGVLSLRAWNPWWVIQDLGAGGSFASDQVAILGPFTLRHLGYLVAGVLELVVFVLVYRRPTRETLALGLAAAVLVAFTFLTTMHERYAFAALAFLAILLPDRRVLLVWIVFSVAFTLNLLAAVPPTPEIGAALPVGGWLGMAGSTVMLGVTVACLVLLGRASREAPQAAGERDAVPVQVVG